MSSKYSEFRKNKQVKNEQAIINTKGTNNQYNIEQIDNMMQVLTVPLNLTKKQSGYNSKNHNKESLSARNYGRSSSRKNSQLSETCDLTTTIDQESISISGNEKLSPLGKITTRSHYTEQQEAVKFEEQRRSGTLRSDLSKDQSLLDQDQQKEESENKQLKQSEKLKIFQKLQIIQLKLSNRMINGAESIILLEKLHKLQMFIDQM